MPQLMPLQWMISFSFILFFLFSMMMYYGDFKIFMNMLSGKVKNFDKWYW